MVGKKPYIVTNTGEDKIYVDGYVIDPGTSITIETECDCDGCYVCDYHAEPVNAVHQDFIKRMKANARADLFNDMYCRGRWDNWLKTKFATESVRRMA